MRNPAGPQLSAASGDIKPENLHQAKASELGVGERTVERWAMAYRQAGEAGLVDMRMLRGRATAVDPRWDEAVRLVLAELVSDSTPTSSAVLRKVAARLDDLHGAGVVPRPSPATAYRRLVFTGEGRLPGVPACPPETLVIDHGKAFLSAYVISVCTRLGQPR